MEIINELQQAEAVFSDLMDSLIVDIASEAHRGARLGLDPRLKIDEEEEEEENRLGVQAGLIVEGISGNSTENDSNHGGVDIFNQKHPSVAREVIECMNCHRKVMAGRFAPHLEKCMGKVSPLTHGVNISLFALFMI